MAGNPRIADPPFDKTNTSDVIIRTPDGVDFYVHKPILSMVSPFFDLMFSLDQPPSPSTDRQAIVDVSEGSETIDSILRLCYPVPEPDMTSVPTVIGLIVVAQKYDMQHVITKLKSPLRSFLITLPLQVFALAGRFHLEDIAGEAATAWRQYFYLRKDKERGGFFGANVPEDGSGRKWVATQAAKSYISEMADISSGMYFRLVRYLQTNTSPGSYCDPPPTLDVESVKSVAPPKDPLDLYGSSYLQLDADTDIIISSIDGIKFPAHRMILSAASRVLRGLLVTTEEQEIESIDLTESGDALAIVLRSCYPTGTMLEADLPLSVITSVLGAALKYKLPILEETAKRKLGESALSQPLEVYFGAISVGWKDGARTAAEHLSRLPNSDLYHPLMETMPAKYYHAVLKFRFEYRQALAERFPTHYRDQVSRGELWRAWMWDADIGKIHPELVVAFARNSSKINDGFVGSISLVDQLKHFETLKTGILYALSQVQLDIAWDHAGTSTST